MIDPRIWLAVLALCLASYGGGRWQQWCADEQAAEVVRLQAVEAARVKEQAWQAGVKELRDAKDAELAVVAAALDDALRELRERPARLPEAARPACKGTTGRELSGPDAEFLARLAARADTLRTSLAECQGWIEKVTR